VGKDLLIVRFKEQEKGKERLELELRERMSEVGQLSEEYLKEVERVDAEYAKLIERTVMGFFDGVMKYFVFQVSYIRNMQYDLERILRKLESEVTEYKLA
jgi:hypothetical protein